MSSMATTQPSRLVELLANPDNGYEIFKSIARQLSPMDLIHLRQTSRGLHSAYDTAVKTQWGINRALQKFVKDPKAFRNKMGQMSSVISGEFALRFFDRWAPGNVLDLWTPKESEGSRMKIWLIEEGYEADMNPLAVGKTPEWGVFDTTYTRPNFEGNGPEIHLHECTNHPIVDILRGYQECTALANIITSTTAYAPFAHLTFRTFRSYMHSARYTDPPLPSGISKTTPGFLSIGTKSGRVNTNVSFVEARRLSPYQGTGPELRSLNDGQTWAISLDREGIQEPFVPNFVVNASEFDVGIQWVHRHYEAYAVNTDGYKSAGLRHEWVVVWDTKVKEMIQHLQACQLLDFFQRVSEQTLEDHSVEELLASESIRGSGDELVETRSTFDEMVPIWYKEWDEAHTRKKNAQW